MVQLGVGAIIAPRWTARIQAVWIGNLVAAGKVPEKRSLLTRDLTSRLLPAAQVQGWEAHMESLSLPDPDDRHVLAAALAAGAETSLTMNLRDFPASALTAHGVTAVHPDNFLCKLHDADPDLLQASTEAAQANLGRGTLSVAAYLDVLDRPGPAAVHAPSAQVTVQCRISRLHWPRADRRLWDESLGRRT